MKLRSVKDWIEQMIKVLLINQNKIPQYRIPVYNYLSAYLQKENYALTVVSCGTQIENTYNIEFAHKVSHLSFLRLARLIIALKPDVIINWVNLKYLYLFPILLLIKILKKKLLLI